MLYNIHHGTGTTLRLVNKSDGSTHNVMVSYRNGFFHFTPEITPVTETPTASADGE